MIYECMCCLILAEADDDNSILDINWERIPAVVEVDEDTSESTVLKPEKFLCNLCLGFYASEDSYNDHSAIHDSWESWGRPDHFSIDTCILAEDRDALNALQHYSNTFLNTFPLSEKKFADSALKSINYNTNKIKKDLDAWTNRPLDKAVWS